MWFYSPRALKGSSSNFVRCVTVMYWLENDCYQMIIAKQHNQETLKKWPKISISTCVSFKQKHCNDNMLVIHGKSDIQAIHTQWQSIIIMYYHLIHLIPTTWTTWFFFFLSIYFLQCDNPFIYGSYISFSIHTVNVYAFKLYTMHLLYSFSHSNIDASVCTIVHSTFPFLLLFYYIE